MKMCIAFDNWGDLVKHTALYTRNGVSLDPTGSLTKISGPPDTGPVW